MSSDSKLCHDAYSSYKSKYSQKINRTIKRKNKRIANGKVANIKFNVHRTPETITETTKEFYRWKKTDGYQKWRRSRFLKQGGLCFYCEEYMPFTRINVEHIVPRSRGGSNKPENLVLSCSVCNKEKGSRMLSEAEILALKHRSKKHRGTYLKNRDYYNNLYGEYSDSSLAEKYRKLNGIT